MTKEQFVDIMTKVMNKYNENDEWFKSADRFAEGITIPIIEHDYLDILLETLRVVMDDNEEWINHYMYENYNSPDWFRVAYKDKWYMIDSFEKLYDLIKGEGDFV